MNQLDIPALETGLQMFQIFIAVDHGCSERGAAGSRYQKNALSLMFAYGAAAQSGSQASACSASARCLVDVGVSPKNLR